MLRHRICNFLTAPVGFTGGMDVQGGEPFSPAERAAHPGKLLEDLFSGFTSIRGAFGGRRRNALSPGVLPGLALRLLLWTAGVYQRVYLTGKEHLYHLLQHWRSPVFVVFQRLRHAIRG